MPRIAYIGNFQPGVPVDQAFSTENDIAKAIVRLGHSLTRIQENDVDAWRRLADGDGYNVDLILWTRTGWPWPDYGITVAEAHAMQTKMLELAREEGAPTVAVHLDKWFGLRRECELAAEPYFRCDIVCTADGAHDDRFRSLGINHHWMMPAVNQFECVGGSFRPEMASDVAFVGSWLPGYHTEHAHRPQLVDELQRYPGSRFWPAPGEHAVRGVPLRDLYASTKVNVGDSCLCDAGRYVSDRLPETIGRGGFLLHPAVDGVTDGTHYTDGEHLVTWPMWDWGALREKLDFYVTHDTERQRIAAAGREHVLANHTYSNRVNTVLELVGLA